MKQLTSLLLVATLIFSSFACTNTTNANKANTYTNQTTISSNQSATNTNQSINNTKESVSETTQTEEKIEESELVTKIKKLCQKETIKTALKGKTISEAINEEVKNMSEEAKKDAEKNNPGLSLDESNFENDEKAYIWLSDTVKVMLKDSIEKGYLTQEQIDQYKLYFALMGVKLPNVEIKKGMSDSDIEKLSVTFVDITDKLTEPAVLKILGVDVNDPSTFEKLLDIFKG